MKILVVSDSHGDFFTMADAMKLEAPDIICHCGDHYSDCGGLGAFSDKTIYYVRGNCDRPGGAPDLCEFTVEGKKVFMTHGHIYGVKSGFDNIVNNAMLRGADILLFGHTHIPYLRETDGLHIMNPGSAGKGMYGIVEIEDGRIRCNLRHV